MDETFSSLVRYREHITNLSCIHKVNSVYHQGNTQWLGFFVRVVRFNFGKEKVTKDVDSNVVVKVSGDLVLESQLFSMKLTDKLGLDDGESNLETCFAKISFFDDLDITTAFQEPVVKDLLLLVIHDVNGVLVGAKSL